MPSAKVGGILFLRREASTPMLESPLHFDILKVCNRATHRFYLAMPYITNAK